ncbi:ribosomal RNA processing 36-like protein [Micractinium conductrix]|uniref:rRNA biogenesis protein RRP36 n=1 Tax=Micractinium conductrix TaxID=554055 RepID=A0A2P6VF26_9CHLO|nr:ribosomal RNA processing 36-like protein [Micractinium conductrix]|eukprot:PSC72696.1 ribosomal RNA processing 36-like protein [Micractinium conductrix]
MKRRPPGRRPNEEQPSDSEEEAAALGKRARTVPHYASGDSEGDSGDSQSDSELSSSDEEGGGGEADEGLPLGQLVALRQDGSTSGPANQARAKTARQAASAGAFLKRGKHAPTETSSKRPVSVLRETLEGSGKRRGRDPRFESLSAGQYDESKFKKRYAFVYDEKLPQERDELKAALARTKSTGQQAKLQAKLTRMEQQLRSEEARRKRAGFQEKVKAKERAAVKDGKNPFFLKKSERRRLELLAKYEELQAAGPGKLEAYMAKRRKRNAAKDHRHLPAARCAGGDK